MVTPLKFSSFKFVYFVLWMHYIVVYHASLCSKPRGSHLIYHIAHILTLFGCFSSLPGDHSQDTFNAYREHSNERLTEQARAKCKMQEIGSEMSNTNIHNENTISVCVYKPIIKMESVGSDCAVYVFLCNDSCS